MEDAIADSVMMWRLLRGATLCFEGAGESTLAAQWHIELHQFSIETCFRIPSADPRNDRAHHADASHSPAPA